MAINPVVVPNYQVFRVDLSQTPDLSPRTDHLGYFQVVRFEDLSNGAGSPGVPKLDGEISIAFGTGNNTYVPLLYANVIKIPDGSDRYRLNWSIQPDTQAVILTSDKPNTLEAYTPNPRQLVTSSVGTGGTASAVSVGAAAVLLSAQNLFRQSVAIQNMSSGNLYIGGDNTVTTATGLWVGGGGNSWVIDKNTGAIYGIADAAAQDVRVFEEA